MTLVSTCCPQTSLWPGRAFSLLGCPIGPPAFCHSVLSNRVVKVREVLRRIPDLRDPQMEVSLLHQCLSFPKFTFCLRSCPPELSRDAASSLDGFVRNTLSDMAGGPISDWSWLKASEGISPGFKRGSRIEAGCLTCSSRLCQLNR